MKARFSTVDLIASITELREKLVGMRVSQIYDVDHKTYLLKLARQDEKSILLLESGIRIHTTEFEWPKNPAPSGFSMKLRKHLKNKRLESVQQMGMDRIVDLQFGINEATYHVIVELYDRGNIVLTDVDYVILNILRPRASGSEDVKFIVREKYPVNLAKQCVPPLTQLKIQEILSGSKPNDNMKKCLNPHVIYGPAVIDHVLAQSGFPSNCQLGKDVSVETDLEKIEKAMLKGEEILKLVSDTTCKGYIIMKVQKHVLPGNNIEKESEIFEEFHPCLFEQHKNKTYREYESFNKAVDNFFSSLEGQKIDQKALQKEKVALKKLENIKQDHEKRVQDLQKHQLADMDKAQLIEINLNLVDKAILIIRSAIANQMGWIEIGNLVTEAQEAGDEVAKAIKKLKLDSNHFTILLHDPYDNDDEGSGKGPQLVDIDLDLTAYANARKYYDFKKHAAKKERKTVESSGEVYKNAEKKTRLALKEVALTSSIIKARKTFWFEKFLWFISSENYLVIAGRDSQQNEVIVKRYLRPGDLYVHADLHGASSVVIKNPSGNPVPPKTQNEAGTMAICYSAAWDAKVVTSAWWVYHHQVSKTAPSGEYLTSGSFMIRGKKNYLPPSQLIVGFGFLFKLDEDSLERHLNERQVVKDEDEASSIAEDENEIPIEDSGSDDDKAQETGNVREEKSQDEKMMEDNEDLVAFPDTEVQNPKWQMSSIRSISQESDPADETTMLRGAAPRMKQGKLKKAVAKPAQPDVVVKESISGVQQSPKRGQKSKLKKIKEKYRDQDDEERELRMGILASAGGNLFKENRGKKGKKSKDEPVKKESKPPRQDSQKDQLPPESSCVETLDKSESPLTVEEKTVKIEELVPNEADSESNTKADKVDVSDDDDEDDQDDSFKGNEDAKVLASLTGRPVAEDTLLFAIPVCAPYSSVLSYKYKVKTMPGTGRRGKASKTALSMFLRDKLGTPREKDLLRSVKDQDISRNLPGKVKLSAPNLSKLKKQ